jgi:hypothetical protein
VFSHRLAFSVGIIGMRPFSAAFTFAQFFFQREFLSRGMAKGSVGKGMSNGMKKDLDEFRSLHVRLGYTPVLVRRREKREVEDVCISTCVHIASPCECSDRLSARLSEALSSSRRA